MAGVYLHIPFCRQACTYCDFHFSTNLQRLPDLTKAMLTEIDLRHSYLPGKHLQSIYFGGGTPSLMPSEDIRRLVDKLNQYFDWTPVTEITLEANPDDIHAAQLKAWKRAGINRLSIGLQSFIDEELRWMNRTHSAQQSLDSVKRAQDEGFTNITIDLIYGSKFQNEDTWRQTLERAIALNTQHVSAYNLTIETKTALGHANARGKEPAIDDELSSFQFQIMREALHKAGFVHYEISNFGKEGFLAQHNSNYWKGLPYLGLGPSAHSYNGLSRQWNVKSNAAYIDALQAQKPFFELEQLSNNDRYNEYVLTRLRTMWGCDLLEMRSLFGEPAAAHFKTEISRFNGLFEEKQGLYTLNDLGRLQADGIASALFLL